MKNAVRRGSFANHSEQFPEHSAKVLKLARAIVRLEQALAAVLDEPVRKVAKA